MRPPAGLLADPLPPLDPADEAEYERRSALRPDDYAELAPDERRRIDLILGLVDPQTGISWL